MSDRIAVRELDRCSGLHNQQVRRELLADLIHDSVRRCRLGPILAVGPGRKNSNIGNGLPIPVYDEYVDIGCEQRIGCQNQQQ